MAGFVLIHGAWHGGWCFDPVTALLCERGHKVAAPDLPGMGGDAETLRGVTLQGWAEFTVDLCRAMKRDLGGEKLVLAGHSRGGVVLSAAAELDPEAMDGLAYICALMVEDGKAGNDMSAVVMGDAASTIPQDFGEIVAEGAGWKINKDIAGAALAQLSHPDLVARQVERLVTEPTAGLASVMHVSEERFGRLPRWYIECEQDQTVPIAGQRRLQALFPGTRSITLDADHSPFYSAPQALADALCDIAAGL
jgi:pimeloyl-ACP methyl ester carboxylesterase